MVTGLLVAIIQALRAFGTAVTPEQEKAVVDLVANLLSVAIFVIGTFAARSLVVPVGKAQASELAAFTNGKQQGLVEAAVVKTA